MADKIACPICSEKIKLNRSSATKFFCQVCGHVFTPGQTTLLDPAPAQDPGETVEILGALKKM